MYYLIPTLYVEVENTHNLKKLKITKVRNLLRIFFLIFINWKRKNLVGTNCEIILTNSKNQMTLSFLLEVILTF